MADFLSNLDFLAPLQVEATCPEIYLLLSSLRLWHICVVRIDLCKTEWARGVSGYAEHKCVGFAEAFYVQMPGSVCTFHLTNSVPMFLSHEDTAQREAFVGSETNPPRDPSLFTSSRLGRRMRACPRILKSIALFLLHFPQSYCTS